MSELDARSAPGGSDAPRATDASDAAAPRNGAGSSFRRLEALDRSPTPDARREADAVSAPQLTRRGRLRKWDRPKPPKDWRWWVGNVGKTLIATGLLMFGFVAYQLWGTGIETARAQNELESEFDALLAEAPPISAPALVPGDSSTTDPADPPTTVAPASDGDGEPTEPAEPATDPVEPDPADVAQPAEPTVTAPTVTAPPVPVEQQNIPALENGDALARLEIPRIGRNDIVVAGVQTGDLKRGPGHFPDTPLPGQLGNSAIAGHRTTYGSPFFDVDDLQVGDEIIATTLNGRYTYQVTGSEIVASNRYDVVATADPSRATLTLISCHPKYTAQRRIVIFSELVATASAPVGEPVINYGRPDEPEPAAGDIDTAGDTADEIAPALDGDTDADGAGADDQVATPADPATAEPDTDSGIDADPGELDTASPAPDSSVTGNLDDIVVVEDPAELQAGQVSDEIVDAFSDGWFSDPDANSQVGLWGVLLSLVGIAAYAISRRLRRDWAGALIGIVPFVVTLYFFFQNVNRLLPPNL